MAIKTFNDGGRFLLVIEPVGTEEEALIKEIKKICGLEGEPTKNLDNIVPPSIPQANNKPSEKSADKPKNNDVKTTGLNVGKGYQNYLKTVLQIKRKELTGEEKAKAIKAVKDMAEVMKTKIPKGDNLRFCIENMSDMFSERIENAVLDSLKLSKEQLVLGSEEVMTEAYKLAVTI